MFTYFSKVKFPVLYAVVFLLIGGVIGSEVNYPALAEAGDAPQAIGTWSNVTSPVNNYFLRSVSIISPNDAWAVGYKVATNGIPNGGVVLFWNGMEWSTQTTSTTSLWSVAMLSATDGWAVGQTGSTLLGSAAILHWDGVSWTSATIPAGCQRLTSVTMVSSTKGWAVGYNCILEYAGSWSIKKYLAANSFLDTVAAVSSTDVWALGETEYGYLFAHYDGLSWDLDEQFGLGDRFNSLSVVTANDMWAVGSINGKILHWGGTNWSLEADMDGALYGVKMKAANDGWAVGTIFAHWDGDAWSQVGGVYSDHYFGVDMKDYYGWAVGSQGKIRRYLEEAPHYDVYLPAILR